MAERGSAARSESPFSGVRAILFDFDDTLVASSAADSRALRVTLERFSAALGGELDVLVAHHDRILVDVKRAFHASGVWAYPEERLARLLAERGADAALAPEMGRVYVEERLRGLAPYPGARAFLDRLRARALRLGVVTNGPARQRHWLRELGFLDAFDAVAIAGEEGVRKPDPRLFELARARLVAEHDVPPRPHEVLVVGDSLEMDVRPARALGMRTAYVAGAPGDARSHLFDQHPPSPGDAAEADVVVARVTDLEEILLD